MIGSSNEDNILICSVNTLGLLDSGSRITSISEAFYETLDPKPILHSITEFGLSVTCDNGTELPYKGYIEADIVVPSLGNTLYKAPVLVVENTDYNRRVPVIIGTNVIRLCKQASNDSSESNIPAEWQVAFDSMCNEILPVKTTNNFSIKVAPGEVKTLSGFVRNTKSFQTAVTEPIDTSLSAGLTICPRVVSLGSSGSTARIPVRVCNLSTQVIEIPPRSLLCSINGVDVVDSWTPDSSVKKQEPKGTKLEDLGVKVETDKLTQDQVRKAKDVLGSWSHIFSTGPTDYGRTDLVEHEIKLTDDTPFKEPYRRIPPGLYEEVRQHLKEMIEAGAIQPSKSPISSNVVLVRKKDGSLRFCIDFRKLIGRTVKDAYTLPCIDDTMDTLLGAKYFWKLDLRSGYWQVEMKEEDIEKTAFTIGNLGFYECNRMAFGLTNAPATFQGLMERCMGELNLKLKASKCEFFKSSVTYLVHVVSEKGIETDPEKIAALTTWPEPQTVKDLRSFLGFTGYYRRFVKDYAKIAKPLNDLLVGHHAGVSVQGKKKKKKRSSISWIWGPAQQSAFDTLKEKLSSPPVLAYADFSKPFILHTDASIEGLEAVLYQEHDGLEKVVAYGCRGLRKAEGNYPAHKLEFLCLKWAVTDKFHDYLYGNTFSVYTDNNPLTYVLTSAKLDATGHRWLDALGSYDFKLIYRSSKSNANADGLSRRPLQDVELFPDVVKAVCQAYLVERESCPLVETLIVSNAVTLVDPPTPDLLDSTSLQNVDWSKEQVADSTLARVVELVKLKFCPDKSSLQTVSPNVLKYIREWSRLSLVDGVLYRNTTLNNVQTRQLVLPLHF